MSEEAKKTAPAQEAEQPETAPEEKAQQAAPEQEPAAEAADPKDDKKKDGGWFNKKARELEAVKAKLDAAEANAAQAKDQLLRMAAEYENYRKRSTREADQKFNDGISFAVNQIIPILDTLDMAANAPTTDENYKKGVVMTLDKAAKALEALHVEEIEALGKPFVILLNSTHPDAPETRALAAELEQSYGRSVLAVSCLDLDAAALNTILQKVLYEFPVRELDFALPRWVTMLDKGHWLQTEVYSAAMAFSEQVTRMKDLSASGGAALACDAVQQTALSGMNLSDGIVRVTVILKPEVFYQVLSEQTGLEIGDEAGLMPCILSLAKASREYEKIRSALEQVEATGYGIVMPTIDELSLEQPEIVQQGGRYGVRLEASAPSIQMMKATIHTEISPIVGTEKQSEDLVQSLLQDFESDPVKLWESNIFGKSLHELVNDGLQNKLLHMPQEARTKMQETLEQVINEGCTGLICILL